MIHSCHITGNSSSAGGGLYLSGSSTAIRNCLIYTTFTGVSNAGGVYTQSGSATLENCTIASNSCGAGGALAGGVGVAAGSTTVRNRILWGNTRHGVSEQGHISTGASATVSYLKSVFGRWNGTAWVPDAHSSPGIDAGCPTDDYSNDPSGNGLRINLGFSGNTPFASLSAAANPEFVLTPPASSSPSAAMLRAG